MAVQHLYCTELGVKLDMLGFIILAFLEQHKMYV